MLTSNLTLTNLRWNELLSHINQVMEKEEKGIIANKNYYMKLFQSEEPNREQLKKMYDQLQNDQLRFDFFEELIHRLHTFNALAIVSALDQCEQSEKEINGKVPGNFHLFIRKEKEKVLVSYFPIK